MWVPHMAGIMRDYWHGKPNSVEEDAKYSRSTFRHVLRMSYKILPVILTSIGCKGPNSTYSFCLLEDWEIPIALHQLKTKPVESLKSRLAKALLRPSPLCMT